MVDEPSESKATLINQVLNGLNLFKHLKPTLNRTAEF